jgi:anti-sigma28 factor (negative regulator of flagellin synthesis)
VAQLYSQVEASTGRPTRQQLELTAESQALMKQQTERLDRLSRAVAALKVKIGKGGLR